MKDPEPVGIVIKAKRYWPDYFIHLAYISLNADFSVLTFESELIAKRTYVHISKFACLQHAPPPTRTSANLCVPEFLGLRFDTCEMQSFFLTMEVLPREGPLARQPVELSNPKGSASATATIPGEGER